MTQERVKELSDYLTKEGRLQAMADMEIEDACAKINADGFAVTPEELQEFDELVARQAALSDGEMNDDELDKVAGGGALIPGIIGSRCPLCGGWRGCFGHVCRRIRIQINKPIAKPVANSWIKWS